MRVVSAAGDGWRRGGRDLVEKRDRAGENRWGESEGGTRCSHRWG